MRYMPVANSVFVVNCNILHLFQNLKLIIEIEHDFTLSYTSLHFPLLPLFLHLFLMIVVHPSLYRPRIFVIKEMHFDIIGIILAQKQDPPRALLIIDARIEV